MSTNFRDFYCDPLKSHTRRIYSYLRVVPAAVITEHPSDCIRSGDLACCNCLQKIRKLNPEIAFVDTCGASNLSQGVLSSSRSQEGAGPSSQGAGPSSQGAGPSSQGSGPSSQGAGPSSQGSGPSSQGSGPSSPSKEVAGLSSPSQQRAGPNSPSQEGVGPSSPSQEGANSSTIGSAPSTMLSTLVETEDSDIDEQLELLKANETLVLHGISPARKRIMRRNKALAKKLM